MWNGPLRRSSRWTAAASSKKPMITAWLLSVPMSLLPLQAQKPAGPITERALREQVAARIDRYRKADAEIRILDSRGRRLSHVQVDAEQIRHSFLFGCAALSLLKHADPAKEKLYQQRFGALFNFATVLTYWQDTDPAPDRRNLDLLSAQTRRLQEMAIRVKGHPLILAGASPRWAPVDPEAVRTLTRQRIEDLMRRFKGQIDIWDVVGDATTASRAQTGLGAWARQAGPAQFTADALRWARAARTGALLLYNDYKLDRDYEELIRNLGALGAPPDALGLEAHMMGSEWPLEKVWNTAETFQRLGKPLHFSEVTVLSDDPKADHRKEWPSTPEGELRQADYVENLYTLLFSHPAVQAIAWWNFVDGDWDRAPGGLLRADLSPKPAYARLLRLVQEKWRTSVTRMTDSAGSARFRGFTGRYRLTLQTDSGAVRKEVDLQAGRRNLFTLRLPAQRRQ